MMYIFKADFYYVLTSIRKQLIIYIIMMLLYFIYIKFSNIDINIIEIMGGDTEPKLPITVLYILLINNTYYYIISTLYYNHIKLGLENIFLRITRTKWIVYKIFSIAYIVFLLLFLQYLIAVIIFNLFSSVFYVMNILLLDFIIKFFAIYILIIIEELFGSISIALINMLLIMGFFTDKLLLGGFLYMELFYNKLTSALWLFPTIPLFYIVIRLKRKREVL